MEEHTPNVHHVLRGKVAAFLARAGFWGSEAEISVRMERERHQIGAGADCSYDLSDEFDQSLLFLPIAIEYLATLPFSELPKEEYENDRYWTCNAIASFMRTWHSALCDTNLMDMVVASIGSTLDEWNRTFPPPRSGNRCDNSDSMKWTSLVDIPPSGVCLGFILEAKVPYKDTALFEFLFGRWIDEKKVPASSANILTLFMYVKCIGGEALLYRNPIVLNSTFDKGLCREHWQTAGVLIENQCPQMFIDALQKELL